MSGEPDGIPDPGLAGGLSEGGLIEGGPVEVSCPHCGEKYTVPGGTNPQGWTCPKCGKSYA